MNKTAKGSAAIFMALAALQPAFAADSKTAAAAAESSSARADSNAPRAAKKYCYFIAADTGSRIQTHSCRTQSEWLDAGFDIRVKKAK